MSILKGMAFLAKNENVLRNADTVRLRFTPLRFMDIAMKKTG